MMCKFELSSCGPLHGKDKCEDMGRFREHQISFQQFMKYTMVDGNDLVVLYNDR